VTSIVENYLLPPHIDTVFFAADSLWYKITNNI